MKCYLVIDRNSLRLSEPEALFVLRMLQRPTLNEARGVMLELVRSDGGTREEIARKLGVSPKTIWAWRQAHE